MFAVSQQLAAPVGSHAALVVQDMQSAVVCGAAQLPPEDEPEELDELPELVLLLELELLLVPPLLLLVDVLPLDEDDEEPQSLGQVLESSPMEGSQT